MTKPPLIRTMLAPRSFAVVGASEHQFWTRNVFLNAQKTNFPGVIYPVNPKRSEIFGRPSLKALGDLPEPVDLIYISLNRQAVLPVLKEMREIGATCAVVVAGGFGETGTEGKNAQAEITRYARENDMLILGPNCPGFVNLPSRTAPYGQRLPDHIMTGSAAFILQSGALATSITRLAVTHGIGLSSLVCMGNEAQLTTEDVLEHLLTDPDTEAIGLFLEQVRNGARFLALARAAQEAGKAIVALKTGRSEAGRMMAMAHTGAVAGDDEVISAVFRQYGVIRTDSLEELVVTTGFMASQPRSGGRRIGIVTGSGGACELMADRAADVGLDIPRFADETVAALKGLLPEFAHAANPLDCAAVDTLRQTGTSATAMDEVAFLLAADPNIDTVLFAGFAMLPESEPPALEDAMNVDRMANFAEKAGSSPCPIQPIAIAATPMGRYAHRLFFDNGLFILPGIDLGMRVLANQIWWAERRSAPPPLAVEPLHDAHTASATIRTLSEHVGRDILARSGVALVPAQLADSAETAMQVAGTLGYPVAAKLCAASIPHKSDVGGVRLNIRDSAELASAVDELLKIGTALARDDLEGVLISPMRASGPELFVGVTMDPTFGPILAVGLGGIWIETIKDVALVPLPVRPEEIRAMLIGLKGAPLLTGGRGRNPVDLDRVVGEVYKVCTAALSLKDTLAFLEVNPLRCGDDAVEVLDVLIGLADPEKG